LAAAKSMQLRRQKSSIDLLSSSFWGLRTAQPQLPPSALPTTPTGVSAPLFQRANTVPEQANVGGGATSQRSMRIGRVGQSRSVTKQLNIDAHATEHKGALQALLATVVNVAQAQTLNPQTPTFCAANRTPGRNAHDPASPCPQLT
jgi:hypothetical protein